VEITYGGGGSVLPATWGGCDTTRLERYNTTAGSIAATLLFLELLDVLVQKRIVRINMATQSSY
jgi:hypothetical protein